VSTIQAALDHGINLIDTAPAYGFGRSEEIVGKAIDEARLRSKVLIATKAGLEWRDGMVFRNASRARLTQEVDDSLRRLRTDYIDIYQVHWPDPLVALEETADAIHALFRQGKIRAIGVSNFSVEQMEQFSPRLAASCAAVALLICSSAESSRTSWPIAARMRSRRSAMARCVGACSPGACGRTWSLKVTICGAPTRNSRHPALGNICPPFKGSISSPGTALASASFILRFVGCSIKASPPRFGVLGTRVNFKRSIKSRVGRSICLQS